MTLGELIALIAKVGQKLQRENPDMTIDEFHAIHVLVAVRRHDEFGGEVRRNLGNVILNTEGQTIILETEP